MTNVSRPRWMSRLRAWLHSFLRVDRDLQDCISVLPVVREQLREAAAQVESSVVSICGSFQGIAQDSSEAVEGASRMWNGGGDSLNLSQSVDTSRATIAELLQRMQCAGEISNLAVGHMKEIQERVRNMESLLAEIERIAFINKLVALNAKIEAVHVGDLGAGFEVVAEEISRQAERTHQLSEGIAARIQEALDLTASATESLGRFVAEDRARRDDTRRGAETALQVLVSVHDRGREAVEAMTGEHRRLRDRIAQATVDLQFQDRLSQRVGHVIEVLERVEGTLAAAGGNRQRNQLKAGSLLDEIQSGYSMQEEREVQARFGPAAPAPPKAMEVELF